MSELWLHNARNQEIEKSHCCSCKWWQYLFLHERDSLTGLIPNLAMSRVAKMCGHYLMPHCNDMQGFIYVRQEPEGM